MTTLDDLHWVSPFDGMGLDEAEALWGKKEREMGPVESELRRVGVRWWTLGKEAYWMWEGAIVSLELASEEWTLLGEIAADVASEAIEAAEALGL